MGKHFRQKFNGVGYTYQKCVSNILLILTQSTPEEKQSGLFWYHEASEFAHHLASTYLSNGCGDYHPKYLKACGIIAAISPLKSWDENMKLAELFLEHGKTGHTNTVTKKCCDILASSGSPEVISEILSGNKTVSFFLNISGSNRDAVTIDRHAIDIATAMVNDDNKRQMTDLQYEFFVNCYRIAARKSNLSPSQLQAITWVTWRRLKKTKNGETES